MSEICDLAIDSVAGARLGYSKFITANDTGTTGGHQFGFYIHKAGYQIGFDTPGEKGKIKDKFVDIFWKPGDFKTRSRFIYYGKGSRNEYRLTRFGRDFPFLQEQNTGDLMVLAQKDHKLYEGFVLSADEDIDGFLEAFGLSPSETNQVIQAGSTTDEDKLLRYFREFTELYHEFPGTSVIAKKARDIYNAVNGLSTRHIETKPDKALLEWVKTEYELFKYFENSYYNSFVNGSFESVDHLVSIANTILNRRKARAGQSLEHHLSKIFDISGLNYEEQCKTEDNKKPDFLFPGCRAYHLNHSPDDLAMLGAKTTCKDRWRQVINEADRIGQKHLFTLQQGISASQLSQMSESNLTLVVPHGYIAYFPINRWDTLP
jgi:type II restriction enzyme